MKARCDAAEQRPYSCALLRSIIRHMDRERRSGDSLVNLFEMAHPGGDLLCGWSLAKDKPAEDASRCGYGFGVILRPLRKQRAGQGERLRCIADFIGWRPVRHTGGNRIQKKVSPLRVVKL